MGVGIVCRKLGAADVSQQREEVVLPKYIWSRRYLRNPGYAQLETNPLPHADSVLSSSEQHTKCYLMIKSSDSDWSQMSQIVNIMS